MISALLLAAASIIAGVSGRLHMNHPVGAIPFASPEAEDGRLLYGVALLGNHAEDQQSLQGYEIELDVPLLQETAIVQYVANRHVRFFAASTLGRSVDASAGFVIRLRQTGIVWEMECSAGTSWRRLALDTLVASPRSGDHSYVLQSDGHWGQWSQFALRARTTGSGPWLELRTLPAFPVGDVRSGSNGDDYYSDHDNTLAMGSIGVGWIFELSRGREGVLGMRQIALDEGADFQLIAQMQGQISLP